MSFYSALVLAANDGVRPPHPGEVRDLLAELGLIDTTAPVYGDDPTVAGAVGDLFRDPDARAENDRFFFPSEIGWREGIEVQHPDGTYAGPGWSVVIHGWGYFYPWEPADLRDRATSSPVLAGLRAAVERRFGGRFVLPDADAEALRPRLIVGGDGWAWLASEDV